MNSKMYMDLKDIIREHALPFLPAKSLCRFQGVCRDWKLQISTPFFAHNQSLSFHAISGLFFQNPGEPPSFISIDPNSCGVPDPTMKFLPVPVDILASSCGLLCCRGRTGDKPYYICNPVTKQWKKLPKPNADHSLDPAVVLIFEPSLLNFEADYKLICAFPSTDFDDATEFEIYSSREGSWKISGEIFFASKKLIPRSGVHVKGVVYWQAQRDSILAFDLTKDRSQLIKDYFCVNKSLGVMGGKLCSAFATRSSIIVELLANVYSNTMQMIGYANMWGDKQRISLDNGVLGGAASEHAAVLFVASDVIVVRYGKGIYSYDLKTKETKALSWEAAHDTTCVSYVNSLVYI